MLGHPETDELRIWSVDGGGDAGITILPATSGVEQMVIGDFNEDGTPDLIAGVFAEKRLIRWISDP